MLQKGHWAYEKRGYHSIHVAATLAFTMQVQHSFAQITCYISLIYNAGRRCGQMHVNAV